MSANHVMLFSVTDGKEKEPGFFDLHESKRLLGKVFIASAGLCG